VKLSEHLRELGVPAWLVRWAIIAVSAGAVLSLFAVIIALALRVQFITIAVLIGFAEVSLLWPVVKWLRDRGVPQVLAAIACVAAFLSFFVLLLFFVVAEVVSAWSGVGTGRSGSTTRRYRA
jgi:predicted PurR-regulated permease PerM